MNESANLLTIAGIAASAAIAAVMGGLIALWRKPTTLFMSIALGFASGVLLATISFEMLPLAQEHGSLWIAISGFVSGFVCVYAFDLFIFRGKLAGSRAEQHSRVQGFYHRHRPRGGEVTVLAGGTSVEELIEGVSIGVGTAIQPGLGLLIGLAIAIDNLSEGLAIGEIVRSEPASHARPPARRIIGWTSLIGAAMLASALAGWFLLRDLSEPVLAFLFAMGGGGMFYLTITDLVPQAEERHYQQSAAIAMVAGFIVIFALSSLI